MILFEKICNRLCSISAFVAGLAMAAMMLQVSLDVILKYLFNWPIPATLETVSSYYMVALVFLPLGIVTRDHEHISVELFTQGLGKRPLALVNAVSGILAAAYVSVMVYYSYGEAWHATMIKETWETSVGDLEVWLSRWFFPIGCTLMLIYLLIHMVDNFAFFFRGERLMTEEANTSKLDLDL